MCKCPKCDVELEIQDMIDDDWAGNDYIIQGYGYCPECKTDYWIDMVYKFSHYEIKEMKDK